MGARLANLRAEKERETLLSLNLINILFIGIRTLFDRVTRGYGDHSPLTRPKEEVYCLEVEEGVVHF